MIHKSVAICFAIFGLVYYFLPGSIFKHCYYDFPKTNITVENAHKIRNMIKLINHYMQKSLKLKHHKPKSEEELSKTIFNQTFVKFIDTFTKVNEEILKNQLMNYTQINSKKEVVNPNYMVKGWPKNVSTKTEDYINFSNPNTAILRPKLEINSEERMDNPQILVVVQSAPQAMKWYLPPLRNTDELPAAWAVLLYVFYGMLFQHLESRVTRFLAFLAVYFCDENCHKFVLINLSISHGLSIK